MGFTFSLFIVLLAIIAFLVLYYLTNQKEEMMEDRKPHMADVELGEELGIDRDEMESEDDDTGSDPDTTEMQGSNEAALDSDTAFEGEIKIQKHDLETGSIDYDLPENNLEEKIDSDRKKGDYSWLEHKMKNKYDKTFIRLFSREPDLLYAYWEVNKDDYYQNKPCLRLFSQNDDIIREIEINHELDSFYISGIDPDGNYQIAIGYKKNGIFHAVSYSDWVDTPLDRPSDVIDERWMTIDELYEEECYEIRLDSSHSLIKTIKRGKKNEDIEENADSYSFSYKD